jgi:hypothetical protein
MTEQIALRFPEGTRDRIKALARDGETMTGVVLRALAALEGQGATHDTEDTRSHQDMRLSALEARIEAMERAGSTPKPDSSEPSDGAEYPIEAKDMAVGMLARKCSPAEIRTALERMVGRAPSPKHLARTLRRWSGQAGDVSE